MAHLAFRLQQVDELIVTLFAQFKQAELRICRSPRRPPQAWQDMDLSSLQELVTSTPEEAKSKLQELHEAAKKKARS